MNAYIASINQGVIDAYYAKILDGIMADELPCVSQNMNQTESLHVSKAALKAQEIRNAAIARGDIAPKPQRQPWPEYKPWPKSHATIIAERANTIIK